MNRVMRIRVGVLLSVAVLGLIVLVAFSQQEKQAAVDPDAYKEFMLSEVVDIYDLQDYFLEQQSSFLPVLPPDPAFILKQSGSPQVLPFDRSNFPPEFNKNLAAEYENSVPVYPITILEDSATRETIFLNLKGEKLLALPPPKDYDPYAYLKAIFPSLYAGWYSSDLISYWQGFYDPSRIQIAAKLIPAEYVEPYLYVAARLADESALSSSGGEGGMLLRSEEAETEIVFESLKRTNAGNRIVIGYPDEFTNRLDVFTGNELMPYIWTFATKGLSTAGTNEITWIDTNYWVFSGPFLRFYSAGNADQDSDGDGYSDASERLVYITDPTNSTSRPVFVSGTVSYSGIETGAIYVLPARFEESWSIAGAVERSGPGAWSNEVGINQSFWFRAFRDVNTNYLRDFWEPWGSYSNTATTITGTTSGLNITLQDQPSVWGSLSYTGSVNGDIWVLAVTAPDSWDTTYSTVIPWSNEGLTGEFTYISFPTNYSLTVLPASNYWIRAFVDSNTNETMNLPELAGQFGAVSIAVSNRRTGIDFSLQAPPSVSGVVSYVTYSGGQTGSIYVVAVASSNSCATAYSMVLPEPGSYQLTNLPVGIYWLWAWRDSVGNNTCGVYEAHGYFTNQAILVTGQLVNVNITMTDPDTDGDGVGDWWEDKYFYSLIFYGTNDNDGDNLMNLYEYYAGTDPTNTLVDADSDGMSDDWEYYYELDPNWAGDAALDSDQDGWTNLEEYNAGTDPKSIYSHPGNCWYVATNGSDSAGRGNYYTNPLLTIGHAFTQASNGQRVIVLPGIYTGLSNRVLSLSKSLMLTGVPGCRDTTIVDLLQGGNFLTMASPTTNVIRYLTIRGGRATSSIYNSGAVASLLSCTFSSNWSSDYGGAVFVGQAASLTAEDCLFEANRGSHPINSRGGALASASSNTYIYRCQFMTNNAPNGGAIDSSTNIVIRSSLLKGNWAEGLGGALYSSAQGWGGPALRFENCTIVENTASNGGALCISGGSGELPVRFTNCIVWGNSTDAIVGTNWRAAYSCIQWPSLPAGAGNTTNNPQLQANRWHLSWYSPCRNTGTNLTGLADLNDLDGDSRVLDGRVDIGADEYVPRTRFMHMPSYDQSNTWGITVAGTTTRVWAAAYEPKTNQWPLSCWFQYGDGQLSKTIIVARTTSPRYYIGTNHVYATTSVYEVSAFMRDNIGVTITQVFYLACRATNDYDAMIGHSIEEGLIWLFTNACPGTNGYYWLHDNSSYDQYVASSVGMALTAFAAHGHRAEFTNVVYSDVLSGGLRYLFTECLHTQALPLTNCPYYNPDANTNGMGIDIFSNYYIGAKTMYEIGPVMTAIAGAGSPYSATPEWASNGIANRLYRDVLQDIADFCGWAQSDTGAGRGGWRYLPNDTRGADNSASLWPALGLYLAENWEVAIPDEMKNELAIWMAYSQTTNGSLFYASDDSDAISPTLTACGLAQFGFMDRPLTNIGVQAARNYLGVNFVYDTNNLYGMHALARAATMFSSPIEIIGTQSWRYVCAEKLLPTQRAGGWWMGYYNNGTPARISSVFGTAAAVSILAETTPWKIIVTQWSRTPWTVTTNDVVSFQAVTLPRPEATNLTLITWYRTNSASSFVSLPMTNSANAYYSTSSIPMLATNTTVEYFLEAVYWREGMVLTNRYPSSCPEDYMSYVVQP